MRPVLLAILALLASIAGCSKPEEKPTKGRFVFTSTGRQGTGGAFLMRDGKITGLGKGLRGTTWSNDGKYIAATHAEASDEIILFDEYGKELKRLSAPNVVSELSWSPDGKKIAYVACTPESRGRKGRTLDKYLYIHDLATHTNTKLYEGDDWDSFAEVGFSPQGDKLVFRSQRQDDNDDKGGVFTINTDGTNLKRISKWGTNPCWFPDGKHIFIVKGQKDDDDSYYHENHKASYWKVNAQTGEVVEELMHEPVAVGFTPRLSRDGKAVVTDKQVGGGRVIVVIPLEGKRKHENIPIYPPEEYGYDLSPDWYQE